MQPHSTRDTLYRHAVDSHELCVLGLQKLLAGMRDRGASAAVLEVEAKAAAMDFTEYVEFDVMVFTNSHEDPLTDECIGAPGSSHAAVLDLFEGARMQGKWPLLSFGFDSIIPGMAHHCLIRLTTGSCQSRVDVSSCSHLHDQLCYTLICCTSHDLRQAAHDEPCSTGCCRQTN